MDILRSCYESTMRGWYRDRPEVEVEGAWHFCAPEADFLPFPTIFTSSIWDEDAELIAVPGEVRGPPPYSKGQRNPRLNGTHFCGSADLWLSGGLWADRGKTATDAEGVPLCCEAGPPDQGGAQVNGRARVIHGFFPAEGNAVGLGGGVGILAPYLAGAGGGRGGSLGTVFLGHWLPASGGGAGGSVGLAVPFLTASGGALGGTLGIGPGSAAFASGGALGGTAGTVGTNQYEPGAGGALGGSSGSFTLGNQEFAVGGGLGGESGSIGASTFEAGAGGGLGGESGSIGASTFEAGAGGGLGGESGSLSNVTEPASGGGAGGEGTIPPGSIAVIGGAVGGESGS